MRELTLEHAKKISVEILDEIDSLCREHQITYYLAYGSLLGAVRHKGFIPWDDDIDLWIPVEQYEKLLNVLQEESKFELKSSLKDKFWPYHFSKLSDSRTLIISRSKNSVKIDRGVAIDLFPLHPCRGDKKTGFNFKVYKMLCWWMYLYRTKQYKLKPVAYQIIIITTSIFLKILHIDELAIKNRIYNIIKQDKREESEFLGVWGSLYKSNDVHPAESFGNPIEIEFEGKMYFAPQNYHVILTNLYNDYMTHPPKEKRVSHHDVARYWNNEG